MLAPQFDEDFLLTDGVLPRRVVAWLVDMLLVCIVAGIAWTVLGVLTVATLGLGAPLFVLLPAIPFAYHWLLITLTGATPGQALCGLSVRRDGDLAPPSGFEALVFTAVLWVQLASSGLWLLVALVTPRHRAFHDMASGLVVVRRRALTRLTDGWTMRNA